MKHPATPLRSMLVRRKALCKVSQKSQAGCSWKKLLLCSHNRGTFTPTTSIRRYLIFIKSLAREQALGKEGRANKNINRSYFSKSRGDQS